MVDELRKNDVPSYLRTLAMQIENGEAPPICIASIADDGEDFFIKSFHYSGGNPYMLAGAVGKQLQMIYEDIE